VALETFAHGQSGEAHDGKGISGQAPAQLFIQGLHDHLSAGDSDKTNNLFAQDSDIRRADVVSELILPGETMHEAIEFYLPATKPRAIVCGFQPPDANILVFIAHGTMFSALLWAGFSG